MGKHEHILLLADIHANYLALRAVIADAWAHYPPPRALKIWFLGDIFGRGPEPILAWDQLLAHAPAHYIVGNHDLGLIGKYTNIRTDDIKDGIFNSDDWDVILAHRKKLQDGLLLAESKENGPLSGEIVETLQQWPLVVSPQKGIYLVHGGLERSLEEAEAEAEQTNRPLAQRLENDLVWDYVKMQKHAAWTIEAMRWLFEHPNERGALKTRGDFDAPPEIVIVGHFHRRTLFCEGIYAEGTQDREYDWLRPVQLGHPYPLTPDAARPILISPGSVGFAREERDRDASYAVLGLQDGRVESVTFHTIPFDHAHVQRQMRAQGYPPRIVSYLDLPSARNQNGVIDSV